MLYSFMKVSFLSYYHSVLLAYGQIFFHEAQKMNCKSDVFSILGYIMWNDYTIKCKFDFWILTSKIETNYPMVTFGISISLYYGKVVV